MESVRFAAKIKADYLLHTKYTPEIQAICSAAGVRYMPSLGKHVNHNLTGTIKDIVAEAKEDVYKRQLCTLTPKEREVFDLYLQGRKGKEIQEILNISQNTLKYHNKNIYDKLGVSSRKELLKYATLMQKDAKEDGL